MDVHIIIFEKWFMFLLDSTKFIIMICVIDMLLKIMQHCHATCMTSSVS